MISLSDYLRFSDSVAEATEFLKKAADREWVFGKNVRSHRKIGGADFGWSDGWEEEAEKENAASTTGEARCLTSFGGLVDGQVRLRVDFRYTPTACGYSSQDVVQGRIPFPSHEMLSERDKIESLLTKWVSDPFNVVLPPSGKWVGK